MALIAAMTAGCTYDEPANTSVAKEKVPEILTLNQLKQPPYMTERGNYVDPALYRTRSGKGYVTSTSYTDTVWLFSLDTIPTDHPLYIRGRITTDDYAGNFYKTMCIQQFVDGKQQALRISVDAGSVGGMYQIGQEIMIRVDGLAIGRYANQPQLCVPSYNNNTNAQNADQKVGWTPGRIPFAEFKKRTTLIGLPETPKCDTISITDFTTNLNLIDARAMDGCLICIKDVHYTGQYANTQGTQLFDCEVGNPYDFTNGTNVNVFAPSTGNVGFPQSRVIADSQGNTTVVSTSEYAKFAYFYLPGADANGVSNCKNYVGNITGILGFYRDNINYAPTWKDWSITIRSLDDLKLVDSEGNLWQRKEYGE